MRIGGALRAIPSRQRAAFPGWASLLLIVAMLATMIISAGCAKRKPPGSPAELPTRMPSEEEAARARQDAREAVPVLPPGERGMSGQDLILAPSETPRDPDGDGIAAPPGGQLYGYRVQLFATADPALAEARASEYRDLISDAIYVHLEGLLYKVQVGDCVSRDEVEALRREIIALGLEGVFIVDTLVNVE